MAAQQDQSDSEHFSPYRADGKLVCLVAVTYGSRLGVDDGRERKGKEKK